MKTLKYCFIFFLIGFGSFLIMGLNQEENKEVRFHQIDITSSSINLIKFNILETSDTPFVKEIIDKMGRTVELRFYNSSGKLSYTGSGFYGGEIIKYDYQNDRIIETFFKSDNTIANDFQISEVPYRHIYLLNNENQIIDIKKKYKIDFEWTLDSFEETIKHLEFYKNFPDEGSKLNKIFGYSYAFAKMNGVNPERKE